MILIIGKVKVIIIVFKGSIVIVVNIKVCWIWYFKFC